MAWVTGTVHLISQLYYSTFLEHICHSTTYEACHHLTVHWLLITRIVQLYAPKFDWHVQMSPQLCDCSIFRLAHLMQKSSFRTIEI